MDRWQYADYARLFLFFLCWKFWLLWQQIDWKYGKFYTKLGSSDNAKSTENIFMKLEIWVDGSLEIMYILFFSSYVENSGCYGNK
jgi:hypothetical protein